VVSVEAGVRLEEARVVDTDLVADNGVVHAIDNVMVPPDEADAPIF